MKNLILITITSVLLVACGQETLKSDEVIQREGIVYKVNSQTLFTGNVERCERIRLLGETLEEEEKAECWLDWKASYKDGKQDGLYETYYGGSNPILKSQSNWKAGELIGTSYSYHKNGRMETEGNYKNGYKDGRWETFFNEGQLGSVGNYKN